MSLAKGYGAESSTTPLAPLTFERREPRSNDVEIDILYCGICHSDLHVVRNEWHNSIYPVIPGHEIIGCVKTIGNNVQKFKVGDYVGVGCLVGSCKYCNSCKEGLEQYCEKGSTLTYNSPDNITGGRTYGGYSDSIVVDENFVLKIPTGLDIKAAAPLLCAGITTYSPLRHWKVGKDSRVGVVGLGGLGHMGIKLAHAMGAEVTMITTSPEKEKDARRLGADNVLLSINSESLATYSNYFDFILNTIPRTHNINPYVQLLKRDGVMVIVGAVEPLAPALGAAQLIFARRSIAGSLIGGIAETQEMLNFCADHNVLPDVEIISIQDVNTAYERLIKNDVKYRFVIDMSSLKN